MLYLFNSKSLWDIIMMCLYGNSKENELVKQDYGITSENLQKMRWNFVVWLQILSV